jgi:hypothetical protein
VPAVAPGFGRACPVERSPVGVAAVAAAGAGSSGLAGWRRCVPRTSALRCAARATASASASRFWRSSSSALGAQRGFALAVLAVLGLGLFAALLASPRAGLFLGGALGGFFLLARLGQPQGVKPALHLGFGNPGRTSWTDRPGRGPTRAALATGRRAAGLAGVGTTRACAWFPPPPHACGHG